VLGVGGGQVKIGTGRETFFFPHAVFNDGNLSIGVFSISLEFKIKPAYF